MGREGTVEGLARGPGNLQEEGASGERQPSWKVLRSAGLGLAPHAVQLSGIRCVSDSQHSKTFQRKHCRGGLEHLPGAFCLSFIISGLHFAFRGAFQSGFCSSFLSGPAGKSPAGASFKGKSLK